ncbi:MAG: lysozyme inhibitor LprI family protein [Verrucomicrobiota bacterium]
MAIFATMQVHAKGEEGKLEVAKKQFAAADVQINKVYQSPLGELSKAKGVELRGRQREWINYRDFITQDQPRYFRSFEKINKTKGDEYGSDGDAPELVAIYWETMTELTNIRIALLRVYSGKGVSKGITGVYTDSYGGVMKLQQTKARVVFSINVCRGPTHHSGEISGVGQIKGSHIFYKERLDPRDGDREPCEMKFTLTSGHIVNLESKNDSYYHGMRAYFDNTYFKSGRLKNPIKLEP